MATGIYKRGKNWWIRYTGIDGKQKRESSNSKDYKTAAALLASRQNSVSEGMEPEIKRIPTHMFYELADKYLSWMKGRQNSARTKGYIIGQLLSRYKDVPLRRFNTALVDQLQSDLIQNGYKPASNNKITNIVKHMFSKAVEWDMVEAEVLKRIRKVKPLKADNKRLRYLSKEECKALIQACDPHLQPIVLTALNTGCRRGEILNLKWDNVDLKHGFILLDKTKNGDRREIPINETLKATLQGIVIRLDSPYVFFDPTTTKPYQEVKRSFKSALSRVITERCTKCDYVRAIAKAQGTQDVGICPHCSSETVVQKGIKDFHFHDLRHTFASHLVMAGVDIATVSKLLGHKSLNMTLRYAHLAPSHIRQAVNILDNALNEKTISTKLAQFGS